MFKVKVTRAKQHCGEIEIKFISKLAQVVFALETGEIDDALTVSAKDISRFGSGL